MTSVPEEQTETMAAPEPGAQARAMFDGDAASRSLGIEIHDAVEGSAQVSMKVTPPMLNGHGTCHGGYLFLLADTAFALACNSHGPPAVAAGADVAFLAPAYEDDLLVATAVERVLRGRSGLCDVTVTRGGEVVAEFRGRSHLLRAAPAG